MSLYIFFAILHKILANQEIIMDQLKAVQLTMQNIQGKPSSGQDPLEKDLLQVNNVNSLLAVKDRLRQEADLKNKMVSAVDLGFRVLENISSWD